MQETIKSKRTRLFNGAPAITLLLLIVLSHSWPSSHFEILPDVMLSIVFYWSVFRPDAPLAETFFFLGLLEDVLLGMPFGFTALVWLSIYLITLTQARFFVEKSFISVWVGFAFVAFAAYTLKVLLFYYYHDVWLPLSPIFLSYLLSVAIYPFVSRVVSLFNRYLHA